MAGELTSPVAGTSGKPFCHALGTSPAGDTREADSPLRVPPSHTIQCAPSLNTLATCPSGTPGADVTTIPAAASVPSNRTPALEILRPETVPLKLRPYPRGRLKVPA